MCCSCLDRLAKILLNLINICFFVCGGTLLGIGIWLLVDDSAKRWLNDLQMEMTFGTDDALWTTACAVIIGVGCFMFVIGFCGCCGVRKDNACLLLIYIISVSSVIVLQLVAVIVAIIYNSEIGDLLRQEMTSSLRTHYSKNQTSNDVTTSAWNHMQFEMECCGSAGYQDWFGSRFSFENPTKPVPYSCCRMNEGVESPGTPDDVEDIDLCYTEARLFPLDGKTSALNPTGCYSEMRDILMQHMYIIIGVCAAVIALEVFALWVACGVRDKIRKPYK